MNPEWKRIQQTVLVGSLALVLLLGNGQPSQAQVSFVPAFDFPTGLAPVAVAIADLNGDGHLDLVVANSAANTVSVLLGTGTGSFGAKADFPTGLAPVAIAIADLNRDGDSDLVVANQAANAVSVLLNVAPPSGAAPPSGGGGGGGGSKCFIATAAFGSPLAPQVQLLRELRDHYLLPHVAGRAFVALYYTLSPPLATLIASSEALRATVRVALTPLIGWAALVLWSPAVGLGVPLVSLAFGVPLVGWVVWQRKRASANRRPGIWRRRL
jgi:hypothetical protein